MKVIKVIELFAGVGGFRIGLRRASNKKVKYKTVWNSQWEPSTKTQHASEIYVKQFGTNGHSCEDIKKVVDDKFHEIPEHNLLLVVFPAKIILLQELQIKQMVLLAKKEFCGGLFLIF